MRKSFSILPRRPGVDPETFAATLRGEHADLVRELVPRDRMRRFVQDVVVTLGDRPLPHGGVKAVVVDHDEDLQALRDWYASPAGTALRTVVDAVAGDATSTVTMTEHVLGGRDLLYDGAGRRTSEATWKVVAFLRRRADITTGEFARYWEHEHGPFAQQFVPLEVFGVGYVQNHAAPEEGPDPAWDGVAEMHFHDQDGLQRWGAWFRSDEGRPLREDEYRFMDPDQRLVLVTREQVVIG